MKNMTKINLKDRIKHFSSNLLTKLNFIVDEGNFNKTNKDQMKDLVNMISMVTLEENIFLGKKPVFFMQDSFLDELIEISCSNLDEIVRDNKIKISFESCHVQVNTDKFYFCKSIKHFAEVLFEQVSFINFGYDKSKNILNIDHDGGNVLQKHYNENCKSLVKSLDTVNTNYKSFSCQVGSTILNMLGLKVEFRKNTVKIFF